MMYSYVVTVSTSNHKLKFLTAFFDCSTVLVVIFRGTVGPAAEIKCVLQGSNKVRLGEKLEGDILVYVKDKHGNELRKVGPMFLNNYRVLCSCRNCYWNLCIMHPIRACITLFRAPNLCTNFVHSIRARHIVHPISAHVVFNMCHILHLIEARLTLCVGHPIRVALWVAIA